MKCGADTGAGEEDGATIFLILRKTEARRWTVCQEAMGQDPRDRARNREKAEEDVIPIALSMRPMNAGVWDQAVAPVAARVKAGAKVRAEALTRVAKEKGKKNE
jgi:hypothetical protein